MNQLPFVEARELVRCRLRAIDIRLVRQPTQGPAQIDDRRHPRNPQRMLRAIARLPIDLAADEERPWKHRMKLVADRPRLNGQIRATQAISMLIVVPSSDSGSQTIS